MRGGDDTATRRAAEQAARQSYGRLVAYLVRSWRIVLKKSVLLPV
jgi:hypothetical protein